MNAYYTILDTGMSCPLSFRANNAPSSTSYISGLQLSPLFDKSVQALPKNFKQLSFRTSFCEVLFRQFLNNTRNERHGTTGHLQCWFNGPMKARELFWGSDLVQTLSDQKTVFFDTFSRIG